MTILVEEYNQVIDGLRMQLTLQRRMTDKANQSKAAMLEMVSQLNSELIDLRSQLKIAEEQNQELKKSKKTTKYFDAKA